MSVWDYERNDFKMCYTRVDFFFRPSGDSSINRLKFSARMKQRQTHTYAHTVREWECEILQAVVCQVNQTSVPFAAIEAVMSTVMCVAHSYRALSRWHSERENIQRVQNTHATLTIPKRTVWAKFFFSRTTRHVLWIFFGSLFAFSFFFSLALVWVFFYIYSC